MKPQKLYNCKSTSNLIFLECQVNFGTLSMREKTAKLRTCSCCDARKGKQFNWQERFVTSQEVCSFILLSFSIVFDTFVATSVVCDMERKFICVSSNLGTPHSFSFFQEHHFRSNRKQLQVDFFKTFLFSDSISKKTRDCNCPVPCRRVRYDPSLSYAQLSHINVERFIVTSAEKRNQLEVMLHWFLLEKEPKGSRDSLFHSVWNIYYFVEDSWTLLPPVLFRTSFTQLWRPARRLSGMWQQGM